jgi:3-phosphoshikimate 1-carboxyvinyltransferase
MRFVPFVAALAAGDVRFDGDARARERPMGAVVDALRQLGAEVSDGGRGALPFTVHGRGRVPGGVVTIDASASSQFVSALLLAAPRFDKGLELRHVGPPVPSQPHIDMTTEMLRAAGVDVATPTRDLWHVRPGPIAAHDIDVEPDLSNAAPFLAAAVAAGGRVTIDSWPEATTQPGHQLPSLLERMGARRVDGGNGLTIEGADASKGSTLTCATSLSSFRRSPHWPRSLTRRPGCAASRTSAVRRQTDSRLSPADSTAWAATSTRRRTGS